MDSEGTQRRRRAQGPKTDLIQRAVADLDPQLADWVDDFVFGRLWGRPGLNENDRMLVAITSLATTRQTDQLRVYLFGALNRGMSARKIHETLVMLSVYAGFPVALSALKLWSQVVASARKQGLTLDLPVRAG